jgi:hypothetical protein
VAKACGQPVVADVTNLVVTACDPVMLRKPTVSDVTDTMQTHIIISCKLEERAHDPSLKPQPPCHRPAPSNISKAMHATSDVMSATTNVSSPPTTHHHQRLTTTNVSPPPTSHHHQRFITTNVSSPPTSHHHQRLITTSVSSPPSFT